MLSEMRTLLTLKWKSKRWHPIFFFSISLFLCPGCIERYFPEKDELRTGTMVVVAQLHNIPGEQTIHLSRSSRLIYPKYDPVQGCFVELMALDGATREFVESAPGQYTCNLEEAFLNTGEAFCLVFITSQGERYESEFEKVLPAPDIDSVYYIREDHPTEDPETTLEGIQFYMDFEIEKDYGRFLQWQLTETFEVHNPEYKVRDL